MKVYVDELPKDCLDCPCNSECYYCNLLNREISIDNIPQDCPLQSFSVLEAKLSEKEKEIEEYKRICTIAHVEDLQIENMLLKDKHQDKISFCIEQLENVRNKFNSKRPIDDLANEVGLELGYTATQIQKIIDNLINELKENK